MLASCYILCRPNTLTIHKRDSVNTVIATTLSLGCLIRRLKETRAGNISAKKWKPCIKSYDPLRKRLASMDYEKTMSCHFVVVDAHW